MKEIIQELISILEKEFDVDNDVMQGSLDSNYFDKGWIDSFGFILFISNIEEKYCISFSNEDFQNREFATLNGLSLIIVGKLNDEK